MAAAFIGFRDLYIRARNVCQLKSNTLRLLKTCINFFHSGSIKGHQKKCITSAALTHVPNKGITLAIKQQKVDNMAFH
jgi:hypothetical protein